MFSKQFARGSIRKRGGTTLLSLSQKVHLSFNDKPILKSFAFVYNI